MKTDLYVATLATSVARLYRVHPDQRTDITAILKACISQADANARADRAVKISMKLSTKNKKRKILPSRFQKSTGQKFCQGTPEASAKGR